MSPGLIRSTGSRTAKVSTPDVGTNLIVSAAATSVLASQLYGVSRLDPAAFAIAPLVLLAVTALASYLPARRAARLNPVTALRND